MTNGNLLLGPWSSNQRTGMSVVLVDLKKFNPQQLPGAAHSCQKQDRRAGTRDAQLLGVEAHIGGNEIGVQLFCPQYASLPDLGLRANNTIDKSHQLTWHNAVYDAANASKVGHDQGDCIRISPTGGTWECRWTTWIPGGSVTVEGPFYDTRDNTIAVTGGTGVFANARGTMDLVARKGGTEYAFIFNLIP